MRNLLLANFSRLGKNRIFWAAVLVMMGISAYNVGSSFYTMSQNANYAVDGTFLGYGYVITLDTILFGTQTFLGIASAVLVSLFVGVEYSDGTMRNKLTVGQKRSCIYLANLITCTLAIFTMYVLNVAMAFVLGLALLEPSRTPAVEILRNFALGFVVSVCFAAIFNCIAMLFSNKTASAVLSLLLAVGLLLGAIYVGNKLSVPEYLYTESEIVDDANVSISVDRETLNLKMVPNPDYLSGTKRAVFSFLYDVNPASQAGQLAGIEVVHPLQVVLYDAIIVVLTGLAGTAAFRRKDVR